MSDERRRCASCGGAELQEGTAGALGHLFRPAGAVGGLRTRAYACLACGYVGHYLGVGRLERLVRRVTARTGVRPVAQRGERGLPPGPPDRTDPARPG